MPNRFIFSLRFSTKVFLKLAKLALLFVLYMTLFRLNFYFLIIFHSTTGVNPVEVLQSLIIGLRFDLLVYGFIFTPIYFLILIQAIAQKWPHPMFSFYKFYFAIVWILICLMTYLDFFHFTVNGQRMRFQNYLNFNWEDLVNYYYKIPSVQIVLFTALLVILLIFGVTSIFAVKFGEWKDEYSPSTSKRFEVLLRILVPLLLILLAARGTIEAHHLELQHSIVSQNTLINELALNAVWCFDK